MRRMVVIRYPLSVATELRLKSSPSTYNKSMFRPHIHIWMFFFTWGMLVGRWTPAQTIVMKKKATNPSNRNLNLKSKTTLSYVLKEDVNVGAPSSQSVSFSSLISCSMPASTVLVSSVHTIYTIVFVFSCMITINKWDQWILL